MKAIIIGSGVAGMATAIRLAKNGHDVTVFEANDYPGGKLVDFDLGDYRFDAGPSLFTMPNLVQDLYELLGEDFSTDFPIVKKDISCKYFWDDGTSVVAHADKLKLAKELEDKLSEPQKNTLKYLKHSERKYNSIGTIFLEKSLHKTKTWLSKNVMKALLKIPSYNVFGTMNSVNESFFDQTKTVQLFNRYATYNGSNPYTTPGILTMIPHLEIGLGTYFPKNGMKQITSKLYELSLKTGVKYEFSNKVAKVIHDNSKVKGIVDANEITHFADLVVSNMDVYPTYKYLLPDIKVPDKKIEQERSSSAIIFYWGISREFPELDLHNIVFSNNYQAEFNSLFEAKEVGIDPTIYINITAKEKPTDAPFGCENWFVMVNAPADCGQDWDKMVRRTKAAIIAKLISVFDVDLNEYIVEEDVLTPPQIQQKTSSHQGSLYGTSSNNRYAAFLRHENFSNQVKGLYFVGGSVHPGGGIPLCLNSAKITAELIQNDFQK